MDYAQTNLELFEQLREAGCPTPDMDRIESAYELAVQLFSGQYRCSGKTFLAHLIGTASILARYHAPTEVVVAGLLHAAYEAGDFGTVRRGASAPKRAMVRERVGPRAEEWIADYHALKWTNNTRPAIIAGLTDIADRDRTVLLMRMANELEETLHGGFLYCSRRRQKSLADSVAACHQVGQSLGLSALAREIRETYEKYRSEGGLEAEAGAKHRSYLVAPASHSYRLSFMVAKRIRGVRRRLRGLRGRTI